MAKENKLIELVRLAQRGQADAKDRLAGEAQSRLRTYVYRVTLDQSVTDDIVQEALLAMLKTLGKLRDAGRFKGWLYAIAQSKISEHYRKAQRKAAVSSSVFYRDILEKHPDERQKDGLDHLLRKELTEAVMAAMRQLKQEHRAVLSLRCFEMLAFKDVAVAMGCSAIQARLLFCRACGAVRKRLERLGLDKSLFLLGLGLFGKATARGEASSAGVAVSPASVKVGMTAGIISALSSKLSVAVIGAALLGVGTWGGYSVLSGTAGVSLPLREEVKSLHYTVQVRNYGSAGIASRSLGAYEQWYYFPAGVGDAVFMRMQRWDPQQTHKLCTWLENDDGNYYYHLGEGRLYINNYHLPAFNFAVRCLPTDRPEFSAFISQVEGDSSDVTYTRDDRTGLLVSAVDRRFLDAPLYRTDYTYNVADRQMFEFYWPGSVATTDLRDTMHKRGWTWFRISGEIKGQSLSGRGQIPFVYGKCAEYRPWLVLDIGGELEAIDCSSGALLRKRDGTVVAAYPSGSFFKGLERPWMGMHTMDTVRRDAAAERIWFDTTQTGDKKDIVVTLLDKRDNRNTDLTYTIDFNKDIIKGIKFRVDGLAAGEMTFSHLQDVAGLAGEFVGPDLDNNLEVQVRQEPGILWLIYLAQGKLL